MVFSLKITETVLLGMVGVRCKGLNSPFSCTIFKINKMQELFRKDLNQISDLLIWCKNQDIVYAMVYELIWRSYDERVKHCSGFTQ